MIFLARLGPLEHGVKLVRQEDFRFLQNRGTVVLVGEKSRISSGNEWRQSATSPLRRNTRINNLGKSVTPWSSGGSLRLWNFATACSSGRGRKSMAISQKLGAFWWPTRTLAPAKFITPHSPEQNGIIKLFLRSLKEECVW